MIFNFYNYCISLSALIENKIFSVHGGLSPAISTLDQVKELSYYLAIVVKLYMGGTNTMFLADSNN